LRIQTVNKGAAVRRALFFLANAMNIRYQ